MTPPKELAPLLLNPNESLSREYKGWLDLSVKENRAVLAKAAIALANHGGGVIILGMSKPDADSGLQSTPRPAELRRYIQDDVNAVINRFADPHIACELAFAVYPDTDVEHAFVIVPGGYSTPVMSRRDVEGSIASQRCYIRKPGPKSEEPFTYEEWRTLLERCIHNGRENMLDAIRAVLQGQAGSEPEAAARDRLVQFMDDGRTRWEGLIEQLPAEDPARMPLGRYELGFRFLDVERAPTLVELRRRLDQADAIRYTGWTTFVNLSRDALAPRPVQGMIEAWLGTPEVDRHLRDPAYCDFWRADQDGLLYTIRGYMEDSAERVEPGTIIDLTLPIWRVAEGMLYASRLAREFGANPMIVVQCGFYGLRGRILSSIGGRRIMVQQRRCEDDSVMLGTQATAIEMDDNLVEVLHPMLAPLYERFEFFELPIRVVTEEVERLRADRF